MNTNLQDLFEYTGVKRDDVNPHLIKKSTEYKFQFQKAIGDDKGVVVLMGWLGSQYRHLQKYSDVLSGMGWNSLRTIPPSYYLLTSFQAQLPYASDILDLILQTGLHTNNRKIVLMAFSNNGSVVIEKFNTLLFEEKYSPILKSVVGIVFDSAPAFMHVMAAANAFRAAATNFVLGWIIAIMVMLFAGVMYPYRSKQFWKCVGEVLPGKPYLYLYSMDDTLTDALKLEELIEEQKSKTKVTTKKWERSIHCTHLVQHKEEYVQALKNFLDSL
eukprot:TRINITY_DN9445_c1_g1_i3.p2 TRINITY_DN9445_c1_g1~~TRINITY_DN9445_c1_g1_i3.p2  ORF type:complete len:290 (-),score=30.39 TRINITY_DN9445_c1_g1_i3:995-1810(-)